MTQLVLYKEALRLLRDSEASHLGQFRIKHLNYGVYHFNGLCGLLTFICDENSIDDVALDIFKLHSEDITGRELNWKLFWFTTVDTNAVLAKQERIEHLEKIIDYYESKGW